MSLYGNSIYDDDYYDSDQKGENTLILPKFSPEKKPVLACFGDEGYVTLEVEDLFPIPTSWRPAFIQADSWFIEPGQNLLRIPSPCFATFRVSTRVRVYYVLHEGRLQQYVDISAPLEEAFVILSLRPLERSRRYYYEYYFEAPRAGHDVEEIKDLYGTNVYVLGEITGLSRVASVKLKDIPVRCEIWSKGVIEPKYSSSWSPTSLLIKIHTDNQDLPYGELFIVSNVSGKRAVIARTEMNPTKGTGKIEIPYSWTVFYKYDVLETKANEAQKEERIIGRISLKGSGDLKLFMKPYGIRDYGIRVISIDPPTPYKEFKDCVELDFQGLKDESSYLIELLCTKR